MTCAILDIFFKMSSNTKYRGKKLNKWSIDLHHEKLKPEQHEIIGHFVNYDVQYLSKNPLTCANRLKMLQAPTTELCSIHNIHKIFAFP